MGVDTSTPEQFSTRTELLAIVYTLYKFRVYVIGHVFKIRNYKQILLHTCTLTGSNNHQWIFMVLGARDNLVLQVGVWARG
jgi:hypothetical protein